MRLLSRVLDPFRRVENYFVRWFKHLRAKRRYVAVEFLHVIFGYGEHGRSFSVTLGLLQKSQTSSEQRG